MVCSRVCFPSPFSLGTRWVTTLCDRPQAPPCPYILAVLAACFPNFCCVSPCFLVLTYYRLALVCCTRTFLGRRRQQRGPRRTSSEEKAFSARKRSHVVVVEERRSSKESPEPLTMLSRGGIGDFSCAAVSRNQLVW